MGFVFTGRPASVSSLTVVAPSRQVTVCKKFKVVKVSKGASRGSILEYSEGSQRMLGNLASFPVFSGVSLTTFGATSFAEKHERHV